MATLKEVAKAAGVSASTVSRALSGNNYVNAATKERIDKAIRELDYKPNVLAKSLKLGRSNTIALMIPSIQNLMFPHITRGVEDTARKNGLTVILCNTDEKLEVEKDYIEKLKNRWIDGFIISSMLPESEHIRQLKAEGFPLVLTARYYGNDMDAVIIDNFKAAYDATVYLLKNGHKKIAFAMGRRELPLYTQRLEGFRKALSDNNIQTDEELILYEAEGVNSFYDLTKKLIQSGTIPDAVFASSDPKAFVIMRALHDCGLSIPADVSVLGFDNVEMSAMMEPPLSTVSQPFYDMGVLAAEKLIAQIEYKAEYGILKPPSVNILPTELIIRKSTQARKQQ